MRAPVDDLELLDKGELIRCLNMAALGIGQNAPGVDRLGLTLCLLKWLTTQQESQRQPGPALRLLQPARRQPQPMLLAGAARGA